MNAAARAPAGTGIHHGVAALRRLWVARNERERRILLAGAAVLLSLLGWRLLVEPALAGRAHWQQRLPALRAERAQMLALARQAGAAARAVPAARTAASLDRAALERSLADTGLPAERLTVSATQVQMNFRQVSFSALAAWLEQSQRAAQLAVSEASVTAGERIDRVDVTLVLRRL